MNSSDQAALFDLLPRAAVPDLQYLAAQAAREGRATDWDRYESQLPQDGFGLLGRYCRACLNGPCRTSPFGRGGNREERGVCGFDTTEMSLAYLAGLLSRGLAAVGAASGRHELYAAAGTLVAAVEPGQSDGLALADAIHAAAVAAGGALAEVSLETSNSPPRQAITGLAGLAAGKPRALACGDDWVNPAMLRALRDAAAGAGVQLVGTASTRDAFELGVPVVVDGSSAELLSGSRLLSGTLRLPAEADKLGKLLAGWAGTPPSADVPAAGQGVGPAAALPIWDGRLDCLFIAGSSKVRSAFGRGGYHQALARLAAERGSKVVGVGDGGYFLAPLADEIALSVASLAPAVGAVLQAQGNCGETVVAFPEPARPAEIAAALALAAAGIRVFLGGDLPVSLDAGKLIAARFGPGLGLVSLEGAVPPGVPVQTAALDAFRDWLR